MGSGSGARDLQRFSSHPVAPRFLFGERRRLRGEWWLAGNETPCTSFLSVLYQNPARSDLPPVFVHEILRQVCLRFETNDSPNGVIAVLKKRVRSRGRRLNPAARDHASGVFPSDYRGHNCSRFSALCSRDRLNLVVVLTLCNRLP